MSAVEPRWRSGLAALANGTPDRAVPLLQAAIAAGEGAGFAPLNLGLALMQLGQLAAAVEALEQAALALPDHPEPPFRLGTIAGLRGAKDQAAALFQAALARDPGHVTALAALAALEEDAGRWDAAAVLVARARAVEPEEPELAFAAARLAMAQGDAAGAAAGARLVLAGRPAHAGAAGLLADALLALHGAAAAADQISAHAAAEPFAACWALAAARLDARAGRPEAALAGLRTADILAPGDPDILAALGLALADAGAREDAEGVLRAAIALRPTTLDLRNRLATTLWKRHRYAEMLDLLDAAIRDFGPEPTLQMNRALALNALGDQDAALEAADAALASSAGGMPALVTRISVLPYHPAQGTAAGLLAAGRAIDARLGASPPPPARPADPDRRLRVGLLSGGLGQHPVGWLTLAGLEALPQSGFDLAAYALKPRQDWLATRFRAACGLWRDVANASDAEIVEAIRADGVDILLDLGGYGDGGRPGVLHQRPAPVQVKWVGGQFAGMGLGAVDWLLTDRWETPPGSEPLYAERLLTLRDGYVCYLPPPYAPAPGPLPALATGAVTFGCFNNLAKLTPRVLACWARILAAVPRSRLVLGTHAFGEAKTRQRVAARLAALGVPAERVRLDGSLSHAALLEAYRGIDIALDPFPYAGGLTVCEALWMGVPVVAMAGDSFCARHAVSHLSNVQLADWVASDEAAYVAQAVAWAHDPIALATLRTGLRARVAASPLVDGPRFGQSLGTALRHAWQHWCAAQPMGHSTPM